MFYVTKTVIMPVGVIMVVVVVMVMVMFLDGEGEVHDDEEREDQRLDDANQQAQPDDRDWDER